jgi:hypothetical protein
MNVEGKAAFVTDGERCDAIMAAIPDRPENPEFKALVPFLLRKPIYTEGRQK